MLTNRTPEAHAWALKEFHTFTSDGQFIPFSVGKRTLVFPGLDGGGEWSGPAIDPATDVLYVGSTEMAWTGGLVPAAQDASPGAALYQNQCAMCHGVDRTGSPPAFPSLVAILNRMTPQQVTAIVKNGKSRMPSFPNIDDPALTALLNYLCTDGPMPNPTGVAEMAPPIPVLGMTGRPPADAVGAAIYHHRCAICHGEQREGRPPTFPMLIGLDRRLTAAQTIAMIHNGKGTMPAAPDLKGPDLDALLRFLEVSDQNPSQASAAKSGQNQYIFTGARKFLDPDGYPAIAPPRGTLNAIDLKTGKYLWKIPLGEYPDLVRQGIRDPKSPVGGAYIAFALPR